MESERTKAIVNARNRAMESEKFAKIKISAARKRLCDAENILQECANEKKNPQAHHSYLHNLHCALEHKLREVEKLRAEIASVEARHTANALTEKEQAALIKKENAENDLAAGMELLKESRSIQEIVEKLKRLS